MAQTRTAVKKYFVFVLVDESQLPAVGVVSINGQSRREVEHLRSSSSVLAFSNFADTPSFNPNLYVQTCEKVRNVKGFGPSHTHYFQIFTRQLCKIYTNFVLVPGYGVYAFVEIPVEVL